MHFHKRMKCFSEKLINLFIEGAKKKTLKKLLIQNNIFNGIQLEKVFNSNNDRSIN